MHSFMEKSILLYFIVKYIVIYAYFILYYVFIRISHPHYSVLQKSVFGTVMTMVCSSLESKIDWFLLRSVECTPEISTWC